MPDSPYIQRVHRVMDHVRSHLDGDLGLEQLARVAHFSPYHFHRIFKATTGETLAGFTRRARLERAAYLMKASPRRELGSIALEVGFSSQSDFSRAFRRLHGIAPSAWDRTSRLDSGPSASADADPASAAAGRGDDYRDATLEARINQHPACRLAYVRMKTWFIGDALRDGYERLVSWLEERGVAWRDSQLLGLSWDNYETTPLDQVRYDFGFAVPEHIAAEGEVGIHRLPAMRAVDVHCRGSLPLIARAWDFLYDEWFPASRHEPDELPAIKRFRTRPDELGWTEWDLDCSIAIRPLRP